MPLPAFMSRKGSSASRKSTAGSAAGGGGGNSGVITEGTTAAGGGDHSEGGSSNSSTKPRLTIPGLGLGRSSSKSQNVSRSPSLYSFRGGGGGNGDRGSTAPPTPNVVSHETFMNGLPPQASLPASRRMPSSSGSLSGPAEERHQSTASPLPSPALSRSSRDGAATSSSSYVHVPSAAGLAAPAVPAGLTPLSPLSPGHTSGPAIAEDSDSDSDDDANETYESPDEFSDSELADLAADSHISTPAPPPSAPAATKQDGGYVGDHEESNHDSAVGQTERTGPVPSGAALAELAQPQSSDTPVQADLRQIWHAISLFLNSQMVTAEEICETRYTERLYYSLGYSMIASMKAMMTFEPKDLAAAVDICKVCLNLANTQKNDWSHATRGLSWSERISGSVTGAVKGSSLTVEMLQRMSMEQRHAELAYAECLLIKAIVTLLYAGDFLAFIREALNMRASSAVYRVLGRFLAVADAADPSGYDASIDLDFRSGIEYGTGSTALILSLLPASAVKVMELFGFHGNREQALQTLMRTGGWAKRDKGPTIGEGPGKEGLRRPVCDLTLLMYHLIISSLIPVTDVDIDLADRILHYNLEKYPQGSFWLYFSGRLYSTQSLGKRAVGQYSKAIKSQTEYRQIQHICNWDLSITYLSLAEYSLAYDNLTILAAESNWSKAAYGYSQAVSLYESLTAKDDAQKDDVSTSAVPVAPMRAKSAHEQREEVSRIMRTIPGYLKKIAGKSLPFEKFVVRKSKKYLAQDGRLCLPGLELGYVLNSLNLSPRYALVGRHLRQVDDTLNAQKAQYSPESGLEAPAGWWDDYLLASFMKGVVLHLIVLPEKHIKLDPPTSPIAEAEGVQQALACFRTVLDHSLKLELDHQIAYFAHYEYARLLTKLGPEHHAEARTHLAAVLEGKVQLGPSKGKGKVSLQNVAVIRANAAMDLLKAA